jgi:membrane AbrB-like protein
MSAIAIPDESTVRNLPRLSRTGASPAAGLLIGHNAAEPDAIDPDRRLGERAVPWLAVAAASAVLALLFLHFQVPASLLLAPMLAAVAFACAGVKLTVGRPLFIAAQGVVGTLVGRSVSPAIITDVAANAVVMIGFVGGTIVAAGIVGWLLARFTSLGAETAAWGSSPGGASAMVAAAADFGADTRLVAFMQYLRVMLVVLSASSVAKILLGIR